MKQEKKEALLYLPLGGVGEIGMNLSLYGYGGKWLIVDMGVSFGDDTTPGVDIFMADPDWIVEHRSDLLGIVLTHGHEDHLGAVAFLWPKLRCPVYASPFTAALLKGKLNEAGLAGTVPVHVVPLKGKFVLGDFSIEMVTQTHSIPEPNSLAIKTPLGTVLHTGDWKFDPSPLIGTVSDKTRLKELGEEGVLAVIGDSTNVFNKGNTGSESAVRDSMMSLFGQFTGRIAVACFASNVARLESIAIAAAAHGRHVALAGRSLWRIDKAARDCGYLKSLPPFLNDSDGSRLAPGKVLYICTGSQGEPRAALARIAANTHPHVTLEKNDVVIFSSRIIPGNEKAISRLQNRLSSSGTEIITERDHFVHVSGHPGREEMTRIYELLRPRIAIPVHGEMRHLLEHAALARQCNIEEVIVINNGDMVQLAPGSVRTIDQIQVGKLALDGTRLVPMDSPIMRERHRMVCNGSAVITLVVDRFGKILGEPQVTALGILDAHHEAEEHEAVIGAIHNAVSDLPMLARQNDDVLRETVRVAVRSHLKRIHGKRPLTHVHLVRM